MAAAIGSPIAPFTLLRLLALQGREAEASAAIASAIEPAVAGGQGMAAAWAHWAAAVLYNGLGPVRGGGVGGPASHLRLPQPVDVHVGAARARRGGRARRRRRARTRCARATGGDDATLRHRLRARHRGALPGAAERRSRPPTSCIARRSNGSAARGFVRSSPARTCSTASGCAARIAGSTRASSYARLTRCSSRSGWRRSPSAHGRSFEATGEKVRKRTVETRDDLTAQERQIARLGPRWPVESGDRCAALPQPADRRMASAQRVRQARYPFPPGAAGRAGRL